MKTFPAFLLFILLAQTVLSISSPSSSSSSSTISPQTSSSSSTPLPSTNSVASNSSATNVSTITQMTSVAMEMANSTANGSIGGTGPTSTPFSSLSSSSPSPISSTTQLGTSNNSSTTTIPPTNSSYPSTSSPPSPSANSTVHLVARSLPSGNSTAPEFSQNASLVIGGDLGTPQNRRHDDEGLSGRSISGEDVSDNDDDEEEREVGGNAQWNGTVGRGELPLLPANLAIPLQKQHPEVEHGHNRTNGIPLDASTRKGSSGMPTTPSMRSSEIGTNESESGRKKRDYISDAVERMKEAVSNAQQQVPGPDGGLLANTSAGFPQTPQIIPIPPIDLSGKTQNIVLVSDTGNVTLRRGNGFIQVETMMVQPPVQQAPKN